MNLLILPKLSRLAETSVRTTAVDVLVIVVTTLDAIGSKGF
jgi:hypothetical protein